jgi:hypothetical protein
MTTPGCVLASVCAALCTVLKATAICAGAGHWPSGFDSHCRMIRIHRQPDGDGKPVSAVRHMPTIPSCPI